MTQKITIEPVTRIEGHAKVTIHMQDDGTVGRAYMHVNEFRGFEKFCEGRPYSEMPGITPRICGICPVSHLLASAKAGDAIMAVFGGIAGVISAASERGVGVTMHRASIKSPASAASIPDLSLPAMGCAPIK